MAIAAGFPLETSDGVAFAKIKKDIPNGTLLSMSLFDVDPAYTPTKNGLQYDLTRALVRLIDPNGKRKSG